HLLQLGGMTRVEADKIAARRRENLEQELSVARSDQFVARTELFPNPWISYLGGADAAVEDVNTGVERTRLTALLEAQTRLPADFHPHAKIERLIKSRLEMCQGQRPLDWSAGEALAFATLSAE